MTCCSGQPSPCHVRSASTAMRTCMCMACAASAPQNRGIWWGALGRAPNHVRSLRRLRRQRAASSPRRAASRPSSASSCPSTTSAWRMGRMRRLRRPCRGSSRAAQAWTAPCAGPSPRGSALAAMTTTHMKLVRRACHENQKGTCCAASAAHLSACCRYHGWSDPALMARTGV